MGCASSRAEDSPLVALCRERRELIRGAADRRYALASAHAAYFRSLAGVGEALHRFVREELTVAPSPPPSPVLTIPSSEGKGRRSSKYGGSAAGNGSAGGAGVDGGGSGSFSSPVTPLSHSLSPEGSHLHFSSPSDSEAKGGFESSWSPPPPLSAAASPNYYYMRSSTAIPNMVYEDPYARRWSTSPHPGYSYEYGYSQYGVPIGSPQQDDSYYTNMTMAGPQGPAVTAPPPPPPPPPPPQSSTWDFFNPFFDSDEQYLPGYFQAGYGIGSTVSSPNSSEVREQEGIPDLEEETEQETLREVRKGKKVNVDVRGKDSDVGSSKAAAPPERNEKDDAAVTEEVESKSSSVAIESKSSSAEIESKSSSLASKARSSGEEEAHNGKKGVNFDGETSLVTEESGSSNVNSLSAHATRDILEVVDEIKEQFKSAASCGVEVSRMLEVGKLPYQSRWRIFGVIYFRILDLMALPNSTSSHPSFKRQRLSGTSTLKNKTSHAEFDKHNGMKSGNLSTTLEKLYMWEKKLYKEVKDEEKLRAMYDKKSKQLRYLDDRGADFYKIDSTQASIRKLSTKISVVIKSIETISNRMHKLRDEELLPQLIELIQGLIRMWKAVLNCHQTQFQAIVDSKIHKLMAKTGVQRNSVAKATRELEMELFNWSSCFRDWISTQKTYVEALNGWLMKWLLHEQEETPDGVVPFSPSRIGAPAAFIISNDWYHAVKSISELVVTEAMHGFTASVHKLWESQREEQRQKLKAEYLSRDFAIRVKSMGEENGMHGHLDIVSTTDDGLANQDARLVALDSLRKRLDEERAKHEETLRQVQEAASSGLRVSLVPIFKALGHFSLETLKAYEGLRISNEGVGT